MNNMLKNIKYMQFDGSFYQSSISKLQEFINSTYKINKLNSNVMSIIVPHAGYTYSGKILINILGNISIDKYETAVILAPLHSKSISNKLVISNYKEFETPFGNLKVSNKLEYLKENNILLTSNEFYEYEHSIEVLLPILKYFNKNIEILPILCGHMTKEKINYITQKITEELLVDDKTIFIISSDFTHYGKVFNYLPFHTNIIENIKILDHEIIDKILNIEYEDFLNYTIKNKATVCGVYPIAILLNLIQYYNCKYNKKIKSKLILYSNSNEMTHDYSNCVSYAGIIFYDDEKIK